MEDSRPPLFAEGLDGDLEDHESWFIPLPATNLYKRTSRRPFLWWRWVGPLAITGMVLAGVIGILLR